VVFFEALLSEIPNAIKHHLNIRKQLSIEPNKLEKAIFAQVSRLGKMWLEERPKQSFEFNKI